jgi:hypothetical protein
MEKMNKTSPMAAVADMLEAGAGCQKGILVANSD